MKRDPNLTAKLKNTDIEIKNYLLELEKENAKLKQRIAQFQVKDVSQQNEIAGLKKAQPKVNVVIREFKEPSKK